MKAFVSTIDIRPHPLRGDLASEITRQIKLGNKIHPGDDSTNVGVHALRRYGLKCWELAGRRPEDAIRAMEKPIVDFMDEYAQVLGSKPIDDIITNWK